uniref:Uncharacterized protein n=1 Tax=Candidozyma auris TaxID=498019 RepID=A0A0L0NY07_CANAR
MVLGNMNKWEDFAPRRKGSYLYVWDFGEIRLEEHPKQINWRSNAEGMTKIEQGELSNCADIKLSLGR